MRSVAAIRADLADCVATFEAGTLAACDAEALVREATAIVNLATSLQMLAASRVAQSSAWRHRGHRTPAEWLAATAKSTVGDAIGALETADKLADCPGVEAQVRAGELTGRQAHALARAVAADPSSETTLLGVARTDGLARLQERCRAVEHAAAGDPEAGYAKIHRERSLRHWTDHEGAFRLAAKLTPDVGAQVLGALAPFERAAFEAARHEDRHEPHDAYAADGLIGLAQASLAQGSVAETSDRSATTAATPKVGSRKPSFTVLVDVRALLRGHAELGETCEIPGVGPVPVSVLRDHAGDAVWHALVTDGVDIRAYCSLTRHIPTALRVALEARDRECVVPGCNTTSGLEIDHTVALEDGGTTTYDNLARPCHHHHRMKHQQGWILAGGPDRWTFTPPESSTSSSTANPPDDGAPP